MGSQTFTGAATVTRVGGLWLPQLIQTQDLPRGLGFGAVTFAVDFNGAPAGTITPRLEGSLDGTDWFTVATIPGQGADTAPGTAILATQGGLGRIDLSSLTQLRLVAVDSGAAADGSMARVRIAASYEP